MDSGREGIEPMENTGPEWSHEDHKRMHALEAECARLSRMVEELDDKRATLEKKVIDLEAGHFADKLEREIDLETWDGIHAARVGHDLEEIADKLLAAIEANRRGEDIDGLLFDIHGDVCCLIADNMRPEGEEG